MPEPDPWPAEPAPGATLRCGTRVLVVDEDERVLLFRSLSDEGEPFWICPGGGIEDGETPEDGARRELREETGLTAPVPLVAIGRQRHVVTFGGRLFDFRAHWFLARTPAFEVDASRWTPLELELIDAHRWWTLPELHAASERQVPTDLADLLSRLLRDGPPAGPLVLGP